MNTFCTTVCKLAVPLTALTKIRWLQFFGSFGFDYRTGGGGVHISEHEVVLHSAIGSQGVALGWRHPTGPLVRQGLLILVGSWRLPPAGMSGSSGVIA